MLRAVQLVVRSGSHAAKSQCVSQSSGFVCSFSVCNCNTIRRFSAHMAHSVAPASPMSGGLQVRGRIDPSLSLKLHRVCMSIEIGDGTEGTEADADIQGTTLSLVVLATTDVQRQLMEYGADGSFSLQITLVQRLITAKK